MVCWKLHGLTFVTYAQIDISYTTDQNSSCSSLYATHQPFFLLWILKQFLRETNSMQQMYL